MQNGKRNLIIVLGIFIFVVLVGGISYAFFTYNKDVADITLEAGEISINIQNISNNLTITGAIPQSDNLGKTSSYYLDFEVNSKVDSSPIYYEVYIMPRSGNTLDTSYLKTYLTDQSNIEIKSPTLYNSLSDSTKAGGKVLYKGLVEINNDLSTKTETKDFRLRLWLDESYSEASSKTFNFDIYLYAYNVPEDFVLPYGANLVRKAINDKINAETNACNPVWVDDMGTSSDETDDITYFSGTNDCVDMNYVWYSGKLWRITAIYPDGAMKLVTEDALTLINWGSSIEYDGSWVYQWLNEDFYDTLYNKESIIVSNSIWNYSTDGNSTPVRPESIATQKTKEAPVGLLNAYEYYNAYHNAATLTNYLNIKYYWFLITPYSTSSVRSVDDRGYLSQNSPSTGASGIRPSIVIKSDVEFKGEGSKSNPYKIVGDKEESINNIILLNTRSTGEYVNFDDDLYRIVDTSDGITKLTRIDYLMDSGTAITKNFASSAYFGKSSNTQTDTYWDYYLNNNWYNSISSTYKNMLVDGTYYLGLYPNATNYKATICKDVNLNNVTTKNCTKYTSSDTDKTFTGKVGLPRVGEMFSAQLGSGFTSSINIWTITPFAESEPPYYKYVRYVRNSGGNGYSQPSSSSQGVRPSITLKSGIKITGGTGYVGGETNSPFEISE